MKKQILALSGGGFRGLYTARLLENLEARVVGGNLGSRFDLIAGTSIGGIIAIALAAGIPAKQIRELIERAGPMLFAHRPSRPLTRTQKIGISILKTCVPGADQFIAQATQLPFDPTPLREALTQLFGQQTIADLKHDLIVPSINFSTGSPKVFKTPHHSKWVVDKTRLLVDVALSTSAAPIYFPNHEMGGARYVDGGLIANSPTLFALHEAFLLGWPEKDVHMLSIGTLDLGACDSSHTSPNKGLSEWGEKLFTLTIAAQEQVANKMAGHRLGDRFTHLDDTITKDQSDDVGFAKADAAAINTLRIRADEKFQAVISTDPVLQLLSHQAAKTTRY